MRLHGGLPTRRLPAQNVHGSPPQSLHGDPRRLLAENVNDQGGLPTEAATEAWLPEADRRRMSTEVCPRRLPWSLPAETCSRRMSRKACARRLPTENVHGGLPTEAHPRRPAHEGCPRKLTRWPAHRGCPRRPPTEAARGECPRRSDDGTCPRLFNQIHIQVRPDHISQVPAMRWETLPGERKHCSLTLSPETDTVRMCCYAKRGELIQYATA